MTGRALGPCAGNTWAGNAWGGRGRGGRGRGGWGRRNVYQATGLTGWQRAFGWAGTAPVPYAAGQSEIDMLRSQATSLEKALESIGKRIEELESTHARKGGE
jgi:hypothetical protein